MLVYKIQYFYMHKGVIRLSILVAVGAILLWGWSFVPTQKGQPTQADNQPDRIQSTELAEAKPTGLTEKSIEINSGDVLLELLVEAGVDSAVVARLISASESVYDLSRIRPGHRMVLFFDQNGLLKKLYYQIDNEEELWIEKNEEGDWTAQKQNIPYQVEVVTAEGEIDSSFYQSAKAVGLEDKTIIGFADIFQWSVDFAYQVKKGDKFKLVYEKRFLQGKYVMPGKILAAEFINNGKKIRAFYFAGQESQGYFDENGQSLRRAFLKAPVAYKYISSGFTTGMRYVSAFNISTRHRAIDYAANYGTPVRAVADGVVTFAGWQGSFGRKVSIRHNSTYSTNYAHMSKIAVRAGERVKQGDVIGYVGSSGLSTGPHVHYELVRNGVKVNPLTEELPAGDPIAEVDMPTFVDAIKPLKERLNGMGD